MSIILKEVKDYPEVIEFLHWLKARMNREGFFSYDINAYHFNTEKVLGVYRMGIPSCITIYEEDYEIFCHKLEKIKPLISHKE